jgi:hypothetical protein
VNWDSLFNLIRELANMVLSHITFAVAVTINASLLSLLFRLVHKPPEVQQVIAYFGRQSGDMSTREGAIWLASCAFACLVVLRIFFMG